MITDGVWTCLPFYDPLFYRATNKKGDPVMGIAFILGTIGRGAGIRKAV